MRTQSEEKTELQKKEWAQPQLTHYGSVEKITLKGFGSDDGQGLEPCGHHPSL